VILSNDAITKQLISCLADLEAVGGYVVLKNADLGASLRRGGDCDVAVPNVNVAARALIRSFGSPRHVVRRSYVTALYFVWGEVDLLPGLTWRGVEVVPFEGNRGRLPAASLAHQATAAWILPLLYTGRFNPRYQPLLEDAMASDRDELDRILRDVFGIAACRRLGRMLCHGEVLDTQGVAPELRRIAWVRALVRSPHRTMVAGFRHVRCESALRLQPPVSVVRAEMPSGVGDAVAWAVENRRFVRGVLLTRPSDSRSSKITFWDTVEDVAQRLDAKSDVSLASWRLRRWWQMRSLRARGWIEVDASGSRMAQAAVVDQFEASIACNRHLMIAQLIRDPP
jgi:hypothetical protein